MKFKLDENAPNILKNILKEKDIQDVLNVRDEALGGSSDHILAKVCKEEKRILITLDMDFSKPKLHEISSLYGVIIIKPSSTDRWEVKKLFEYFLENFNVEDSTGKIVIIEEDRIRIREKSSEKQ
jgi:predicted nuclease of predicted toxin-antitoxin system